MPPMRVRPVTEVRAIFEAFGLTREDEYVYQTPDRLHTIFLDADQSTEDENVVVEFLAKDLRGIGLNRLADKI